MFRLSVYAMASGLVMLVIFASGPAIFEGRGLDRAVGAVPIDPCNAQYTYSSSCAPEEGKQCSAFYTSCWISISYDEILCEFGGLQTECDYDGCVSRNSDRFINEPCY